MEPMFGDPIGPWFRWFAWRPTHTTDRGWRWLRPVWRRRYQTKSHLDGPTLRWFVQQVADPEEANLRAALDPADTANERGEA